MRRLLNWFTAASGKALAEKVNTLSAKVDPVLALCTRMEEQITAMTATLEALTEVCQKIELLVEQLAPPPITGITVEPGVPVPRPK